MITPRQKKIMQHALGLDRQKVPYRNRYFAGPGHDRYDDCIELCKVGYMEADVLIPDLFTVNDAGQRWLGVL